MIQPNLDATTHTWHKPYIPRLFKIEFNHNKIKPFRSGRYQAEVDALRHETQTRYGTLYADGLVTLDNGVMYDSLSQMKEIFETMGTVSDPQFLDEMEQE